jgi:AraC-like DNA-binding protein
MEIIEHKPNEKINHIIDSYYLIETTVTKDDIIPPLGHPVIQFHLKNDLKTFFSNYDFPIEAVFIIGQLSKFAKITSIEHSKIIGVNLKPTALHKLTNINMALLTDKGVPASYYFNHDIYNLLTDIKQSNDTNSVINLLDNYFMKLIENKPIKQDKFDYLITRIIDTKGKITLEEIETICPMSSRTRQRYFTERIGLSMKTYLRVIRNLSLFKLLNEHPNKPISELIFAVGYYDYSHFNKDFKLMTGITPLQYFSTNQLFTKELLNI